MNKIALKINDMSCKMCETCVADTIRKVLSEMVIFKPSYRRGKIEFLCERNFDQKKGLSDR